jgi:hypothetical protein
MIRTISLVSMEGRGIHTVNKHAPDADIIDRVNPSVYTKLGVRREVEIDNDVVEGNKGNGIVDHLRFTTPHWTR